MSIRELAMLELELLSRVEWQIVPKFDQLANYYEELVKRSQDYVLEEDESPQLPPPAEEDDEMQTDPVEPQGNVSKEEPNDDNAQTS